VNYYGTVGVTNFIFNDYDSFQWVMYHLGVKCHFGVQTVITNSFSAIPILGQDIVIVLWGG
jgi:quinol-cytochrome oxidoreductase complex cytochrome b subunit